MGREAATFLRERVQREPAVGVVLGSGLGAFAAELSDAVEVAYGDIPKWPFSTAKGHAGTLVFGTLEGVNLVVMSGRAHLYEGYTPAQVTYGIRTFKQLGVHSVILTNAAGAINTSFQPGDLVLIADHINFQGSNPLVGLDADEDGPQFPDMTNAYTLKLRDLARAKAIELGIGISEGVYIGVLGPSYETPAEIRFFRAIGADMVGMSTVPEVIVANRIGMRVLAISCMTNMAAGVLPQKIDHQEVLDTGEKVKETLGRLIRAIIPQMAISPTP